jgi:hypothetical protein
MILKCLNKEQLVKKGLIPLDLEVDTVLLGNLLSLAKNRIIIIDRVQNNIYLKPFKRYDMYVDSNIWMITEDSLTDNLDNQSLTYYHYNLKEDAIIC